jgi:hypothetical protein
MIKKLFFTAALLALRLAYGANPGAVKLGQIDPPSSPRPNAAAAAGFTTTSNSNNTVNSHNAVVFNNFHLSEARGFRIAAKSRAALLALGMLLGTPPSVAPATLESSALVEHTPAAPDTIRPPPKQSGAEHIARPSRKSHRCRR